MSIQNLPQKFASIEPPDLDSLFAMLRSKPGTINLSVGEPDFDPPDHVKQAANQAWVEGFTHYTPVAGIEELRRAIAQKMTLEYALSYDADDEITVTCGATEALYLALQAILNPGDQVLIPDPCFVSYEPSVILSAGQALHYALSEANEFLPDLEELKRLTTERTKAIIINTPNNPTGMSYSENLLKQLAGFAAQNNLFILSDEVYEKLVYDTTRHSCLANCSDDRERTVIINSMSKTYAMTGIRVGYVLASKDVTANIRKLQCHAMTCVDSTAQKAALAALTGPQDFVQKMVREYDHRRRLIVKRLNELPFLRCKTPNGAFYVFARLTGSSKNCKDVSCFLLENAQVLALPGRVLGAKGAGYLRFSYATSYELIEEAMNRLRAVSGKLN